MGDADDRWLWIGVRGAAAFRGLPIAEHRLVDEAERALLLAPLPYVGPSLLLDGTTTIWRLRMGLLGGWICLEQAAAMVLCRLIAQSGWQKREDLARWYSLEVGRVAALSSATGAIQRQISSIRKAFAEAASSEPGGDRLVIDTRKDCTDGPPAYRFSLVSGAAAVALVPVALADAFGLATATTRGGTTVPLAPEVARDLRITESRRCRVSSWAAGEHRYRVELLVSNGGRQIVQIQTLALGTLDVDGDFTALGPFYFTPDSRIGDGIQPATDRLFVGAIGHSEWAELMSCEVRQRKVLVGTPFGPAYLPLPSGLASQLLDE